MFFSKTEFRFVFVVLSVLVVAIALNLQVSYKKGRDLQRKNDISSIQTALTTFQSAYKTFPMSDSEGRIVGCIEDPEQTPVVFSSCEWGVDQFSILEAMPTDPLSTEGWGYYYQSNGKTFQIFVTLERNSDPEYKPEVFVRNLPCGGQTCNFGRAYGNTPLDKSLEEYENEVVDK